MGVSRASHAGRALVTQESMQTGSDLKFFIGMRWGSFGDALGEFRGPAGLLWGFFGGASGVLCTSFGAP